MTNNVQRVAVVGLGYVGLPLALLADEKGLSVVGIDIDEKRIAGLKSGESPFEDAEISDALRKHSIEFTTDASVVADVDIAVICVPTPVHEDTTPNLGPVKSACESIAPHMKKGQVVVLESTVNPGVSETVVLPILEEKSGLKAGEDFDLAHCPERINPGDDKWTVRNIPRVIGALTPEGTEKAAKFYESIIEADIKRMGSLKEAEAVKIVENSFRDINIAFVNELAMSFSELGIDVVSVIDGASTKPFAFMAHYPGVGVGGHCIPVDPYYMIEYAKNTTGFSHDFLKLARKINSGMPAFTARQVMDGLNKKKKAINGAKVAVLGISYKANIDDMRESPSFVLIDELKELGAEVVAYDPHVPGKSDVDSLEGALDSVDAVVLATAHNEFKELEPANFTELGIGVVIDGRNMLREKKDALKAAGIEYRGIGVTE